MVSTLTTNAYGLKGNNFGDLLDPLDSSLAKGVVTGWRRCAEMMQKEVVARAPVDHGDLRDAFASPDAIAETDRHHWRFGLLTPEMQHKGSYWHFVEYGTRGHGPLRREYIDAKGHIRRRTLPASQGRRPHPFVRPGILAGRRSFTRVMAQMMAVALSRFTGGISSANATSKIFALKLRDIDQRLNERER